MHCASVHCVSVCSWLQCKAHLFFRMPGRVCGMQLRTTRAPADQYTTRPIAWMRDIARGDDGGKSLFLFHAHHTHGRVQLIANVCREKTVCALLENIPVSREFCRRGPWCPKLKTSGFIRLPENVYIPFVIPFCLAFCVCLCGAT